MIETGITATDHALEVANQEIARITRDRDDWKGRYDLAAELAVKFSCERDAAIAQRDQAVEAGWKVTNAWYAADMHLRYNGYEIIDLKDVLIALGSESLTPDKLAAEREAGRREGIEAAAKVADAWLKVYGLHKVEYVSAQEWASDATADVADSIRALALRDTPAAPEMKLLPCPFCGSEKLTHGAVTLSLCEVSCDECEASMPSYENEPTWEAGMCDAKIKWNTRHALRDTPANGGERE